MKSAGELILYKDFSGTDEEIFYPMASIIERSRRGGMDAKAVSYTHLTLPTT